MIQRVELERLRALQAEAVKPCQGTYAEREAVRQARNRFESACAPWLPRLLDAAERVAILETTLSHLRAGGCDPGMRLLCRLCRGDYDRDTTTATLVPATPGALDTEDPRHPHEPAIPPTLDADGRCLVCGLLCDAAARVVAAHAEGKAEGLIEGALVERERCKFYGCTCEPDVRGAIEPCAICTGKPIPNRAAQGDPTGTATAVQQSPCSRCRHPYEAHTEAGCVMRVQSGGGDCDGCDCTGHQP